MIDFQTKDNIFVDSPPFEEMISLEHIPYSGVIQGAVGIVHYNGALFRGEQSRNNGQKSGLAASAGSHNSNKLRRKYLSVPEFLREGCDRNNRYFSIPELSAKNTTSFSLYHLFYHMRRKMYGEG